ncbi:MAG: hypothetical protein C4576_00935 [Desulfobacteraceae bacterium]|nr:MAG: hypothetical protein C4576_00935 [Desulfobacteraceae bacterium]
MGNRIRRHADPFQCRVAISADDWTAQYEKAGKGEVWLDLGCGKGEFFASLAENHPDIFFIGIEVRRKIATTFFCGHGHLSNLLLLHGNVNLSIPSMMGTVKARRVFIHFPDPCDHKARYRKRQMVNERLVEGIGTILAPDGIVSVKTDRRALFEEMDGCFRSLMKPHYSGTGQSLLQNAASEWEEECRKKSIPVFSMEYALG